MGYLKSMVLIFMREKMLNILINNGYVNERE